jgi:hypothetical protein
MEYEIANISTGIERADMNTIKRIFDISFSFSGLE